VEAAVIWDLDGTLLDSYDVIVDSIFLTFQEAGISMSHDRIKRYAICASSRDLFHEVARDSGNVVEALFARYSQISGSKYLQIKAMNGALDTLQALRQIGVENYVYTHRGRTTIPVLDNLNMTQYFAEVLTSRSGFARKPDPEAITYLIEKHGLDTQRTYYVGDRGLDIACANNAGIKSVLFRRTGDLDVSSGKERYVISDLKQILDIINN